MKKQVKHMNEYKRYTKLNIFDRFLNYVEYLTEKYVITFCAGFMVYVSILLLIDIIKGV